MFYKRFNKEYLNEEILDKEARYVIDADFKEIYPQNNKAFFDRIKRGWLWINQSIKKT